LTRVDFYVSKAIGALARERIACRLAAKAVGLGHRLHIHCADEAELKRIDELLWTFNEASFLAHDRLGESGAAAITLDTRGAPEPAPELLINLAAKIPAFFSSFPRVAEIVDGEPTTRESSREHFRFYRDRGYPLQHHAL
jgi:DNA polymerase-3 subunit chi